MICGLNEYWYEFMSKTFQENLKTLSPEKLFFDSTISGVSVHQLEIGKMIRQLWVVDRKNTKIWICDWLKSDLKRKSYEFSRKTLPAGNIFLTSLLTGVTVHSLEVEKIICKHWVVGPENTKI